MIKLFVSDLDGTLLSRQLEIEAHNKQAIEQAMKQNIHIAIASGRMSKEIYGLMKEFPQGSYAIGQNGATIYSKEFQLVKAELHKPETAQKIMQLGLALKELTIFVNTIYDDSYIIERNARTEQYESRIISNVTAEANLEKLVGDGTISCSKVTFLGDITLLEGLKQQLIEMFGDTIEIAVSDFDCLDVTPRDVSKGKAVTLIMEQLGIEPHEVACIGDSYNDLSMFKVAEHSFAMRHSDEAIRAQAKYVVNNVAEAIQYCLKLDIPS